MLICDFQFLLIEMDLGVHAGFRTPPLPEPIFFIWNLFDNSNLEGAKNIVFYLKCWNTPEYFLYEKPLDNQSSRKKLKNEGFSGGHSSVRMFQTFAGRCREDTIQSHRDYLTAWYFLFNLNSSDVFWWYSTSQHQTEQIQHPGDSFSWYVFVVSCVYLLLSEIAGFLLSKTWNS